MHPKICFVSPTEGERPQLGIWLDLAFYLRDEKHVITRGEILRENGLDEDAASNESAYKRNVKWVSEADALVFEMTMPNSDAGLLLGLALSSNKPALVLFDENGQTKVPKLTADCPKLQFVRHRGMQTAKEAIDTFLDSL